jgi:hypothetical protein
MTIVLKNGPLRRGGGPFVWGWLASVCQAIPDAADDDDDAAEQ